MFLLTKSEEVIQALGKEDPHNEVRHIPHLEELVRWELPPKGWVIFDTDCAAKGNPGAACAGGVLRGDKTEWVGGFSENLGNCSLLKA